MSSEDSEFDMSTINPLGTPPEIRTTDSSYSDDGNQLRSMSGSEAGLIEMVEEPFEGNWLERTRHTVVDKTLFQELVHGHWHEERKRIEIIGQDDTYMTSLFNFRREESILINSTAILDWEVTPFGNIWKSYYNITNPRGEDLAECERHLKFWVGVKLLVSWGVELVAMMVLISFSSLVFFLIIIIYVTWWYYFRSLEGQGGYFEGPVASKFHYAGWGLLLLLTFLRNAFVWSAYDYEQIQEECGGSSGTVRE